MVQIASEVPRRFLVGLLTFVSVLVVGCTGGGMTSAVAPGVSLPTPVPAAPASEKAAASAAVSVTTRVPPPTPRDLQVRVPGANASATTWARDGVDLSAQAPATDGDSFSLEVEVVATGQNFTGSPSARGPSVEARDGQVSGKVTITGLKPGRYAWRARFVNASGAAGAWLAASPEHEFGIVGTPPKVSDLAIDGAHANASHLPLIGASDRPTLRWQLQSDQPDALEAVYVLFDQKASTTEPPTGAKKVDSSLTSEVVPSLKDGTWYAHVWAADKAGQKGAAATLKFEARRTPPSIADLVYRSFVTNPRYQTLPIRFSLSEAAQVDVSILPQTSTSPLRTFHLGQSPADKTVSVAWDGKDDKGKIVPAGSYRFAIQAIDAAGNTVRVLQDGLTITNKVIVVTLSNESIRAIDGDQLFLTSLVTSGGQELPTRTGQFEIIYKAAPFVFHSPYPHGSQFWYPDTPSNYAMLFDPEQGNFIHDAPWRTVFGPGTDGPGTPGYSIYAGSHGCVELPTYNMTRLFAWTPVGAPVIVQ